MNVKRIRVNEVIDSPQVRLVDQNGQQVGVIAIAQALEMAEKAELDLVEVAPNSKPPVCRIMNFGKYKYEISKKAKVARKNRHVTQVKEIKLRKEISEHDFAFKMKHAEEFMKRGDKVKFTLVFRGREIIHMAHGEEVLKRVMDVMQDMAVVESPPRREGNNLTLVMNPK